MDPAEEAIEVGEEDLLGVEHDIVPRSIHQYQLVVRDEDELVTIELFNHG
jgi:hypothetical protein